MEARAGARSWILAVLAAAAVGLAQLLSELLASPSDPRSAWLAVLAILVLHALLGSLMWAAVRLLVGTRGDARVATLVAVAYLGIAQLALGIPWGAPGGVVVRVGGVLLAALLGYLALRQGGRAFRWLLAVPLWCALDVALVLAVGLAILDREAERAGPAPGSTNGAAGADGPRPSVLLVSIDTLRADFVGAYGRTEARTPVLDGLAAEGARFEYTISQSVITGPSHATMLTGLLPTHHGVLRNLRPLRGTVPTLAEALGAAGFDTGAFVGGFPLKQQNLGVLERFATYDERFHPTQVLAPAFFRTAAVRTLADGLRVAGWDINPHHRPADRVTDAAVEWLAASAAPYFCFVHYFDPHLPFEAPEEFESDAARAWTGPGTGSWHRASISERVAIIETPGALEQMARLYDAEIAFCDRELGRLIRAARERAGSAGLWIVVTSDHGESQGEREHYFERTLYDDTVRVPLILVPPTGSFESARGRVIGGQARTLDVAPTLLDACGLSDAFEVDGASLLPSLAADGAAPDTVSLTAVLDQSRASMAVRTPGWKAIWREAHWDRNAYAWRPEERELYELGADPGESRDLGYTQPDRWERLAAELELLRKARPGDEEPLLDPEQLRALKALGYAH